tara:strand:+ start:20591 stop:21712 length:1122 start_codon:yes stop_codon:yes gene_type:complete
MVKKIVLTKKMDSEVDNLKGEFLSEDYMDTLIDFDCDVYKSADIEGHEELLFKYRKNVITDDIWRPCMHSLRKSIQWTDNRGTAAGAVSKENFDHPNNKPGDSRDFYFDPFLTVEEEKEDKHFTRSVIRKDGTVSDTKYANKIQGAIVGYFDRYVRFPYCRETAFTKNQIQDFDQSLPMLQRCSELMKELTPEKYEVQRKACENIQDFVIDGTVFTTVTVNRNFQTAGHYDAGDLNNGLTILFTMGESWEGGYLLYPKWGAGVDLRPGDFLVTNVHGELHGNSPIRLEPENPDSHRMSCVLYVRELMSQCGTKGYEQMRKDYHDLVGHKPGIWTDPEWEYVNEVGYVKEGMFESTEYKEWLKMHDVSLENFFS